MSSASGPWVETRAKKRDDEEPSWLDDDDDDGVADEVAEEVEDIEEVAPRTANATPPPATSMASAAPAQTRTDDVAAARDDDHADEVAEDDDDGYGEEDFEDDAGSPAKEETRAPAAAPAQPPKRDLKDDAFPSPPRWEAKGDAADTTKRSADDAQDTPSEMAVKPGVPLSLQAAALRKPSVAGDDAPQQDVDENPEAEDKDTDADDAKRQSPRASSSGGTFRSRDSANGEHDSLADDSEEDDDERSDEHEPHPSTPPAHDDRSPTQHKDEKTSSDAAAEEAAVANEEAEEEDKRPRVVQLAEPRWHSKKWAEIDAERKAAEEAEARKRTKAMERLKKHGPSDRVVKLGAPRPVKVDPRAGRPPPEIEERQRVADLKFKETVKRRAQAFDQVLEREQQRLHARFLEYAQMKGLPVASDILSGDATPEELDAAAVALVLTSTMLTGVPPTHASPVRHGGDVDDDGLDDSNDVGSSPRHASPERADGSVAIAGHVSDAPTSTERPTFRPDGWKSRAPDDVTDVASSPSKSSAGPSPARDHQPRRRPGKSSTPTPSVQAEGGKAHKGAKAAGARSSSSTPLPTVAGGGLPPIKRTKCVGAGGLTCIDGAVSDFILGDGNVRHGHIPEVYRRRTNQPGHHERHAAAGNEGTGARGHR